MKMNIKNEKKENQNIKKEKGRCKKKKKNE